MIDRKKLLEVKKQNEIFTDFSKIKIGLKTIEDATLDISTYRKANPRYGDKNEVLMAINNCNYEAMREISNFYFRVSGIYSRLCRYMAYLYRYDWFVTPYIISHNIKNENILNGFSKILNYLDNSRIKDLLGEIALKVIRNGCYYGYILDDNNNNFSIQELPVKYCRSRFKINRRNVIEFNVKFFDECFLDIEQRKRILNLFPQEFRKAYNKYKESKLPLDYSGDEYGWFILDIEKSIKFNLNDEDFPAFISVIPALIDLDEAQGLNRKKMRQDLLKIIIQKLPLDKNGDSIFDQDEVELLHSNAVRMLANAIGIDVLTTFAETTVEDMADSNKTANDNDNLGRSERRVYNEAGVSQMQFNTGGNIALEKSILNDESAMFDLLTQFEYFLNLVIDKFNTSKKLTYRVQILNTTIYNYKDLSKTYKELTSMGYSKMLPQIALGQSQSSILANAYFENDILDLVRVFIPPMNSNTMSSDSLSQIDNKGGRPELDDDKKSDKTIANRQSMS